MNTKKNTQNWKFPKLVFGVFLLCIFLLEIQFAYLSISSKVYGKDMDEFAQSRSTVKKTISATRGTIYDANQNILALNVSSYTLIAYLEASKESRGEDYVKDIEATAKALSPVLGVEESTLIERLSVDRFQVEFGTAGKGLTELKKEEIESLGLSGIDFIESQKRYYPNGNFASYVIGYAKNKEVETEDGASYIEITGELGVESKYNDLLKGTDGYLEYQRDRYGYKISGTKETKIDAIDGYDIHLTLDATIQRFVESAIKQSQEIYSPEWLQLTVMDAKTGDILGTTSTPSFDPNIRDVVNYENPFVTMTFEPGSVMKTYTYMCAIDSGKYDGSALYQSGSVQVADATIRDWNQKGWGMVNYDKGYEYSSNVGIVNLIRTYLSKKELKECFKKYGFGKTTGIEISREAAGSINFNYEVEVANAGFGQGITTTAIQQLQALTIIANEGKMVKPHIVKEIINPNTKEVYYERKVEISDSIVKKSTADKLKQLMYNTIHGTDPGTTGRAYNVEGLDVIGKTGTAQIYNNELGGYFIESNVNKYIFSFSGMFPYENPQYIIYAAMKIPTWGQSAGLSLAVTDVIESIAKYEKLDGKENNNKEKEFTIPSYMSKDTSKVKIELETKKLNPIIIGDGNKIINQYPAVGTKLIEGDKVLLLTNSNHNMPNIIGWSKSDVSSLCNLFNISCKTEGNGYATSQSITVGTTITPDMNLEVNYEQKYELS